MALNFSHLYRYVPLLPFRQIFTEILRNVALQRVRVPSGEHAIIAFSEDRGNKFYGVPRNVFAAQCTSIDLSPQ